MRCCLLLSSTLGIACSRFKGLCSGSGARVFVFGGGEGGAVHTVLAPFCPAWVAILEIFFFKYRATHVVYGKLETA